MRRWLVASGLVAFAGSCIALALHARSPQAREQARGPRAFNQVGEAGEETREAANAAEQMRQARTSPSGIVEAGAYSAAFAAW